MPTPQDDINALAQQINQETTRRQQAAEVDATRLAGGRVGKSAVDGSPLILDDGSAKRQREAERVAQEAFKADQRQRNAAAEAQFRQEGRPHYTNSFGELLPSQTDEAWQAAEQAKADKAAAQAQKERQKQEAARAQDTARLSGRKYVTSAIDGMPLYTESEEQLAQRRRESAEKIRRSAFDERIKAAQAEGNYRQASEGLKPLTASARAKLEKELASTRTAASVQLRNLLTPKTKEVVNGDDWIPFNESASPEAIAAQERQKRLQQPGAELDDTDLADLEANDATKPLAAKLRNLRALLDKDAEAGNFQKEQERRIAELTLQRDDPARYAALVSERRSSMSPDALQKELDTSSQDIQARTTALQQRVAAVQQARAVHSTQLADLSAQAAARRSVGIPAGEIVVFQNADGSVEHWPRDLAQQRERVSAQQAETESSLADEIASLELEQSQLQQEVDLHNRSVETARTTARAQAEADQASALATLQSTPGMSQAAKDIAALRQSQSQRLAALSAKHDGNPPPEAVKALEADVQRQSQAALAAGQQRLAAAQSAYQGIKQRIQSDEAVRADTGPVWKAATENLQQSLGISEQEARDLLNDVEAMDWDTLTADEANRQAKGKTVTGVYDAAKSLATDLSTNRSDDTRTTRVLSNGSLIVSPNITDEKGYKSAVEASSATPEAKAAALARYPEIRRATGREVLNTLDAINASEIALFDTEEWQKWKARRPADVPEEEWAMRYTEAQKKKSAQSPLLTALKSAGLSAYQGLLDLRLQGAGLLAGAADMTGLPGSETLMGDAAWTGRKVQAAEELRNLELGKNNNVVTRGLLEGLPRLVPSLLPAAGGARLGQGALRLFGATGVGARYFPALAATLSESGTPAQAVKAIQQLTTAGMAGTATASGAQTYASQLAEVYATLRREHPELDHQSAMDQAQMPAIASGMVTAGLTLLGGKSGVEKLLSRPVEARAEAAKVVGSFLQRLGVTASAAVKGGLKETIEEGLDEMFSTVAKAVGTGRTVQQGLAQFAESFPELAVATFALGGAGEGVARFQETGPKPAAAATTPSANLPETVAAAESAIDNFTMPNLSPLEVEQAQRRAGLALNLAQGGDLLDVQEADLNAAGWTRNGGKVEPLKGYTGPAVMDVDADGRPIIKDSYVQSLRDNGLAAVAAAIPGTETETRNRYLTKAQPSSAKGTGAGTPAGTAAASAAPQETSADTPARPTAAAASASPNTSAQEPGTSTPPAASAGQDTTAPSSEPEVLSRYLQERGLPAAEADRIAPAVLARPEFQGRTAVDTYRDPIKFREALTSLGVTGSLNSKDAATNPLRTSAKPAAESSAAAPASSASAAPGAASPENAAAPESASTAAPTASAPSQESSPSATPSTQEPIRQLRAKLAAKEISDIDAVRSLRAILPAKSTATEEALEKALVESLGWKPFRANIAARLVMGDGSPISLSAAQRAKTASSTATSAGTPTESSPAAAGSTPATPSASPLTANAAYSRARTAALARVKDPARKEWARRFFAALEDSFGTRHALYDAIAVGPVARQRLNGSSTAVDLIDGRVTRLIDLDRMVANFDYLAEPEAALRATGVEEDVHAVVLRLAQQQPTKYGPAALRRQWRSLPRELQETVWRAYQSAQLQQSGVDTPPPLPASLTKSQEYHLQNEFLRMLVQDRHFAGAITESTGTASGLIGWIQGLLKDLSSLLKKLLPTVDSRLRPVLDSMVEEIAAQLRRYQSASADRSRLATLPALRDPAAAALQALESGVLFQHLARTGSPQFSPAALSAQFDALSPALQSLVFQDWNQRQPGTPARRAPKDALMRHLLTQMSASPAFSAQVQESLLPSLEEPEPALTRLQSATRLLRRLVDSARSRLGVLSDATAPADPALAPLLNALAATPKTARVSLLALHGQLARASADLAGAQFVQSMPAAAQRAMSTESPAAALRRANAAAEESRRMAAQRFLRRQLMQAAQLETHPLVPATEDRGQAMLDALLNREAEASLNASPAARLAIRQRLLAQQRAAAYLRGESQAEIQLARDQGRLSPEEFRVVEALLRVARGDFSRFTPAQWRLSGESNINALRRVGIGVNVAAGRGSTLGPDSLAYIERNHLIIRQSTLDDLARRLPATRQLIRMSEAEARSFFGLPLRPVPEPTPEETAEADSPAAPDTESPPVSATPEAAPESDTPLLDTPARTPAAPVAEPPKPSPRVTPQDLFFAIPLSKRGQVRRSRFPDADSLAAFQFKLDADTIASARSKPADVAKAEQRGLSLLSRMMEDTGMGRAALEERLLAYHTAVVQQAEVSSAFGTFAAPPFHAFAMEGQRSSGTNASLPPPVGGDALSVMQSQGIRRLGPPDASDDWTWFRELQSDAAASRLKNTEAQRLARAGDVADPKSLLAWFYLNVVSPTSGRSMDEAASELANSEDQPLAVDSGDALGRALVAAVRARFQARQLESGQSNPESELLAQENANAQDFATYAAGAAGEPRTAADLSRLLSPEEEVQIGQEWFAVVEADADTASLTLESPRFGTVTASGAQVLNLTDGPNHLRLGRSSTPVAREPVSPTLLRALPAGSQGNLLNPSTLETLARPLPAEQLATPQDVAALEDDFQRSVAQGNVLESQTSLLDAEADLEEAADAWLDEEDTGPLAAAARAQNTTLDTPSSPAQARASMASDPGAAQTTEPTPGGLSEAEVLKIRNLKPSPDVGFKGKKPVHLYRGTSKNSGSNSYTYGKGLYTTTDKKQAAQYGTVSDMDPANALPSSPLYFPTENAFSTFISQVTYDALGLKRASEFETKIGPDVALFLKQVFPQADGIQIGVGRGSFFVKWPSTPSFESSRSESGPLAAADRAQTTEPTPGGLSEAEFAQLNEDYQDIRAEEKKSPGFWMSGPFWHVTNYTYNADSSYVTYRNVLGVEHQFRISNHEKPLGHATDRYFRLQYVGPANAQFRAEARKTIAAKLRAAPDLNLQTMDDVRREWLNEQISNASYELKSAQESLEKIKGRITELEQRLERKKEAFASGIRIGNGKPFTTDNQREQAAVGIQETENQLAQERQDSAAKITQAQALVAEKEKRLADVRSLSGTGGAAGRGQQGAGSAKTSTGSQGYTTPIDDVPDGTGNSPQSAASVNPESSRSESGPLPAAQRVQAAAEQTDTAPTPAQKEAGNYAKGKVWLNGLHLSIESPRGTVRSGTDAQGRPWSVTLPHHYGYFLGTEGRDGDHVDVFVGPNPDSQQVLIVNQRKVQADGSPGGFDEHKVMLGFDTAADAARAYRASYTPGWQGLMSAIPTTVPVLKRWLTGPDTSQPFTRAQADALARDLDSSRSADTTPLAAAARSSGTPQARTASMAARAAAAALAPVDTALGMTGAAAGKVWQAADAAFTRSLSAGAAAVEIAGLSRPFAALGNAGQAVDRQVSAALMRVVDKAKIRTAADAARAWLDQPEGSAPRVKGIIDTFLPTALLPREWLALYHESQRKTAFGAEVSLDLIRALSGNPRFSDLAYPPGFAQNPVHKAHLFEAMEGKRDMASLPPELQRLAGRLRTLLRETGLELVRQGIMHPDTFEELQADGWMPRYTEDDSQAKAGSITAAFKLGVKDLLQQRSTAFHIVDTAQKDRTGQYLTVNRPDGSGRNRWRFRDAAERDAFYRTFVNDQALQFLKGTSSATPGRSGGPTVAQLMAALDSQQRREVKAEIATLTRDALENPATLSPALAGIVKQARKLMFDRFAPVDPSDPPKLIKDPVYAVARYVLGQTHNAATMELLRATAARPEWVSPIDAAGFKAIPDNPRFGPLAGKFLREDIAAQVLDLVQVPNAALQFYDSILRKWKAGKLVYNPASHIRDAVGNTVFAYLAGNSPWNPANWQHYRDAIHTLRNGGDAYRELIEQQVLGGDAYSGLVQQKLKGLLPDLATMEDFNPGALSRRLFGIGAKLGKTHTALTELRRLPDDIYKTAAYLQAKADYLRQNPGADPAAARRFAAEHVRKWFPYYDRLGQSGFTRQYGRFVSPFFSFFRESTRILGTSMKERPVALAAALAFPSAITTLSSLMLGLGQDDEEEIKKDMTGRGKGILLLDDFRLFSMLLPFRSAQGAVQQWDLSSIMPFADLLGQRVVPLEEKENALQTFLREKMSAGPVLGLIDAWKSNRDSFSGRRIVENDMSFGEKLDAYTNHAVGVLSPPLVPDVLSTVGIGSGGPLSRAGDRQTNKTLQTYDPTQTVVRSLLGMNVKNANPNLYRLADDFRKARGYDAQPEFDSGVTLTSRVKRALVSELAQREPNLTAIRNLTRRLKDLGVPLETEKEISKVVGVIDPAGLIGGSKKAGLSAADARLEFRLSLTPEARELYESALREFEVIQQRAPLLIQQAQSEP